MSIPSREEQDAFLGSPGKKATRLLRDRIHKIRRTQLQSDFVPGPQPPARSREPHFFTSQEIFKHGLPRGDDTYYPPVVKKKGQRS